MIILNFLPMNRGVLKFSPFFAFGSWFHFDFEKVCFDEVVAMAESGIGSDRPQQLLPATRCLDTWRMEQRQDNE